jgi:hypothetical protein
MIRQPPEQIRNDKKPSQQDRKGHKAEELPLLNRRFKSEPFIRVYSHPFVVPTFLYD